ALLAVVPGKGPWNLERPLVGRRWCVQQARPPRPVALARARPLARGERERVVEQRDTCELLARDELVQQSGAGQRAVAELRERSLAPVRLWGPPHRQPPAAGDGLLVGAGGRVEPCAEATSEERPVRHGPRW